MRWFQDYEEEEIPYILGDWIETEKKLADELSEKIPDILGFDLEVAFLEPPKNIQIKFDDSKAYS